MPTRFAGFEVEQVIVHEIPRRSAAETGTTPTLSDVPSPLDDDLRLYFREKIIGSLDEGVNVVRDAAISSPVPAAMLDQFEDKDHFVQASHVMAKHLHATQTGVNPSGLLVLVGGVLRAREATVVLKLEMEEALGLRRERVEGGRTFHVRHLRDLTLGKRTRVFKAGLFPRFRRLSELDGVVSDDQRGYQHPAYVANFFLRTFLGCKLAEAPEHTTRRFFDDVQKFINERVASPEAKARYELALLAEMQATTPQVDPRRFAARSLDPDDARELLAYLEAAGAPVSTFDKDVAIIKPKVDRLSLEMINGIKVSGSRESWEESVAVEELPDGSAEVNVRGRIRKVAGG